MTYRVNCSAQRGILKIWRPRATSGDPCNRGYLCKYGRQWSCEHFNAARHLTPGARYGAGDETVASMLKGGSAGVR